MSDCCGVSTLTALDSVVFEVASLYVLLNQLRVRPAVEKDFFYTCTCEELECILDQRGVCEGQEALWRRSDWALFGPQSAQRVLGAFPG